MPGDEGVLVFRRGVLGDEAGVEEDEIGAQDGLERGQHLGVGGQAQHPLLRHVDVVQRVRGVLLTWARTWEREREISIMRRGYQLVVESQRHINYTRQNCSQCPSPRKRLEEDLC